MKVATYALALVVVFVAALELGFRVRPLAGASTGSDPRPAPAAAPGGHGGADHDAGHAPKTPTTAALRPAGAGEAWPQPSTATG